MKHFVFVLVALLFLSTVQSFSKGPYTKERSDLNIGIGLGSTLYGTSTLPPITASYEFGFPGKPNNFTDKVSIGPYAGIAMAEDDWYWGTWTYTHIIIGARGSYHFYNEDNIDAYGGLMIGYNIVSSKYESKHGYDDSDHSSDAGSGLTYSLYVGGRYYFSPGFGVYAELGYGIAYLSLGVTLKM
jgi:hypothetical protein